ncbi:MAG: creatininase family protein [Bacteroidota bacterium]
MAEQRKHILASSPYKHVRDATYDLAVLPWAATEAHNYHLPYGTDIIETDRIASEAGRLASEKGARVVILPTVPFGVNTGQMDIPLTINMNPGTQVSVLDDVATSLERQGIGKLLLLNGHGGNDFKQMIRELKLRHTLFICTANWYTCVDAKLFFKEPGDHAGEMETSLMMYLAPELVLPLSEAGSGGQRRMKIRAFQEGWAWTPREWLKVTTDTGTGDPRAASAEKGEKYFQAVTAKIADFLVEVASADAEDLYE